MAEYLTKEEIRQWRSSLEKITLEEYAARLGKVIQGAKETNDMIDKVMTHSLDSMNTSYDYKTSGEKIQSLTLKNYETKITTVRPQKEKPEQAEKKVVKEKTQKKAGVKEAVKKEEVKEAVQEKAIVAPVEKAEKTEEKKSEQSNTASEMNVTFKKPLIPREQMIFDFLVKNKGSIVYAKDMAALLELPRDYVYKYIKNLRQKINEDVLCNADNGGYILKV